MSIGSIILIILLPAAFAVFMLIKGKNYGKKIYGVWESGHLSSKDNYFSVDAMPVILEITEPSITVTPDGLDPIQVDYDASVQGSTVTFLLAEGKNAYGFTSFRLIGKYIYGSTVDENNNDLNFTFKKRKHEKEKKPDLIDKLLSKKNQH